MTSKEKLAELFADIAQWLEMKGDNPFKIRAYETAARIFEQLDEDPALLAHTGKLEEIPGVGKAIAAKALEFFETGRIHQCIEQGIHPGHHAEFPFAKLFDEGRHSARVGDEYGHAAPLHESHGRGEAENMVHR